MKLGSFNKQPGETESYTVTYEDALTDNDFVKAATATITPQGTTPLTPALTLTNVTVLTPRVRMFASGGVDGGIYKIEVTTTTNDGRILEDEFTIRVKEL